MYPVAFRSARRCLEPRCLSWTLMVNAAQSGRPGEICIAGKGLEWRYLGQPELTAEKFPTLTFNNAPLRIYRTGDIGLMDDEGIIHFRGRQDRQVKIAGHRVELAEIEETARALPGIRHCTAFALEAPDSETGKLALIYLTEPGNWPGAQADINDPLHVRDHLLLYCRTI